MNTRFSTIVGVAAGSLLALTAKVQAQFNYEIHDGTVTITKCTGPGGDVVIPDTIEGKPGTSIWYCAFSGCIGLTGIVIPDSVTRIEGGAFYGCTGLIRDTIGNGVTAIRSARSGFRRGAGAFEGCTSLACVDFQGPPPSVVGRDVFSGADNVTVYYLPGATGWGPTFGDRPTALWIPITPNLPSVTVDNPLRLRSSSPAPATVRVQRSANLVDWEDWQTVSRDGGPSDLEDTEAGTTAYRFYRLREQ